MVLVFAVRRHRKNELSFHFVGGFCFSLFSSALLFLLAFFDGLFDRDSFNDYLLVLVCALHRTIAVRVFRSIADYYYCLRCSCTHIFRLPSATFSSARTGSPRTLHTWIMIKIYSGDQADSIPIAKPSLRSICMRVTPVHWFWRIWKTNFWNALFALFFCCCFCKISPKWHHFATA